MAATREKRSNAGNKMSRLLEAEDEDDFYKTTYGVSSTPDHLQEVRVDINVDVERCNKSIQTLGVIVPTTGICVKNKNPYAPACNGDSGGPLVCQNKYGRWELVGVASFGKRGCRGDQIPVIYQSVPYHIDWILQNTGIYYRFTDIKLESDVRIFVAQGSTCTDHQLGNVNNCLTLISNNTERKLTVSNHGSDACLEETYSLNNQLRPITTGYPKGPQASADFNNHGVCNEIPAIKVSRKKQSDWFGQHGKN
ncbi:vacuolar protein sorting-associated protein 72 [Mytilus galloprovincialis]|uniref:Vacuolar protein sorting-associated protein 72 n=1 Tax=Mytilus galloprovincialis TaxID=29158 RepID=A0A8B6CN93_MYTGA|nr:vacuolar protein sorting-associated protein 72 [Mytilus galloprovincialis]